MGGQYYNRYQEFLINGEQTVVPFVTIPNKPSDKVHIYKVSEEYYGSPYFGWLILQANPQFGGLEQNIFDGAFLVVPYPLITSLQDYKAALDNHFLYYGR
jgi:hypothetical protein